MGIVFLCIYCTKIVYDNELFPAQKCLTLRVCAVDSFRHQHFWNSGDFCSLFSMYRTKFDAKMTKSKWNYTANMIMNVSWTVCQHIHYFHGKQWLAIDPWELDVLGLLSVEGSCREFDCLSLIIYAYIIKEERLSSLIIYAYDEWQLSNSMQDPSTLNKLNTSNSRELIRHGQLSK